jgi:hypothetical protein
MCLPQFRNIVEQKVYFVHKLKLMRIFKLLEMNKKWSLIGLKLKTFYTNGVEEIFLGFNLVNYEGKITMWVIFILFCIEGQLYILGF